MAMSRTDPTPLNTVESRAKPGPRSLRSRIIPKRSQGSDLFREQWARIIAATDRGFAVVLGVEWVVGIALAVFVSPLAWAGTRYSIHEHVWAALFLGGTIALPPALIAWFSPGRIYGRQLVAIAQILMAALYIHLTGGRIETHFMIFGSLAFLAFYRDWKVLTTASLVVLVDHLMRGWLFPQSVFGVDAAPVWRSFEHFWWVIFADVFLFYAILRGNRVQASVASEKIGELGQYVLKERLGGGGMGEVFLAEHRLLKRPCAIKLIRSEHARDPSRLNRFEREVQATSQLRHPNTVGIYDFGGLEDGTLFYVMEYLPGLSLQQLVERHGPLSPARTVNLLRQICGALAEAHAAGLIHRDVKPDNVLLCSLGGLHDVTKLFDFGLVQVESRDAREAKLTQVGLVVGTPEYMSPEQVTGDEVDLRTDLFSLGAVAYFLLTGTCPYGGDNSLSLMYARVREPARPPTAHRPGLPEDLERVVMRCLSRDKSDRFSDAKQLERALAECACVGQWSSEHAAAWWAGERAREGFNAAPRQSSLQSTSGYPLVGPLD
jgi:tRNA A-37 threonylcarbamoyl transferase component Bud32